MIRVCLSAPFCPQLGHSSCFTGWPEIWIVPAALIGNTAYPSPASVGVLVRHTPRCRTPFPE